MKKKKGFTLVELLVVIAILAILATVSVVGYMGFTKKAHESNDIGLTTQMNTILQAEEVTNKPTTPHDAVNKLANGGVDVEKLTPTTDGYNYVYDLETNRMFLLDNDKHVVAPTNIEYTEDLNVFAFVGSEEEINNWKGYSVYLKTGFTFNNGKELTLSTGVDTGDNEVDTINYTNEAKAQTVTIRTNGGTLNVNAGEDTVYHYGLSDKVVITAVADKSFHEYGKVEGNIEIASGRVEVSEDASVETIVVTGDGVKVDSNNEDIEVVVSDNVTVMPNINGKEVSEESEKITLVNTINELKDALYSGKNAFLNADFRTSYQIFMKKGTMKNGATKATLNLNGHKVIYYSSSPKYFIAIDNDMQLTVEGKGTLETSSKASVFCLYNATLVINDGKYVASNNDTSSSLIKIDASNQGTVIINDGTFYSKEVCVGMFKNTNLEINGGTFTSLDNFIIGTNGSTGNINNTITINAGEFNGYIESEGYIACGIYAANNDVWNINGGTFNITNGCGVLGRSGTVNVGENVKINLFNDENNPVRGKVGDSKVMVFSGAAIVKDNAANYSSGKPTINNNSIYEVTVLEQYEN